MTLIKCYAIINFVMLKVRTYKIVFLTLVGLFTCLFVFCLWQKKGDCGINLRIDSPKVNHAIPPGESKSGQIRIENPTEQTTQVRCYFEDWFYTPPGDGGKDFRPASSTPLSCASWIRFSPSEFSLPPYSQQLVNYVVNVPADASGGHYAVLFFETVIGEGQDEQGLSVLILGRLGSLFYVQVEGTVNKEAILKDITIKEQKAGFQLSALFKNIGNVDITATGHFDLIDRAGMVFARGEFNQAFTFPQDEVLLESSWDKNVTPGIYDLIITLDLGEKALVEEREVKLGESIDQALE